VLPVIVLVMGASVVVAVVLEVMEVFVSYFLNGILQVKFVQKTNRFLVPFLVPACPG
jgi:hypothetical protein